MVTLHPSNSCDADDDLDDGDYFFSVFGEAGCLIRVQTNNDHLHYCIFWAAVDDAWMSAWPYGVGELTNKSAAGAAFQNCVNSKADFEFHVSREAALAAN